MSAIWPLDVAIDTAIQNDAALSAKLKGEKVYSLTSPALDTQLPYIVLGSSSETTARTYDSKFRDTILTISVWSADITKAEVAGIVADLERLLDATQLTVGGHHFVSGAFSVVAMMLDGTGRYGMASCRYEALNYV